MTNEKSLFMHKFILMLLTAILALLVFPFMVSGASITITDLNLDVEGTSALVSWRTGAPTSGCVQFGLTNDYDLELCSIAGLRTAHDLLMNNLLPETLYHFRVLSKDASGTQVVSTDGTLKTGERSDSTEPEITSLNLEFVGYENVLIVWETNEETRGTLNWGTGSGVDLSKEKRTGLSEEHEVHLNNLEPGTLYYYQILATDDNGNETRTAVQTFRTALNSKVDGDPLVITQVKPISPGDFQIHQTNATVTWRNSRPADGEVIYGTEPRRLNRRARVDHNRVFQEVELVDLEPGQKYYFRIKQQDFLGKRAEAPSKDSSYSFTTNSPGTVLGATSDESIAETAVLSILDNQSRLLGAFTSIYTPATALLKTEISPRIFAVLNGRKHWLKSLETLNSYGYSFADVKTVTDSELNTKLNVNLVKAPDKPAIYYIYRDLDMKIVIPGPSVFESYPSNDWLDVVTISDIDLESFPDAVLVKTQSSPTVYLLENNSRRPFVSLEALERFGWNLDQVAIINEIHLNAISEGERIE